MLGAQNNSRIKYKKSQPTKNLQYTKETPVVVSLKGMFLTFQEITVTPPLEASESKSNNFINSYLNESIKTKKRITNQKRKA